MCTQTDLSLLVFALALQQIAVKGLAKTTLYTKKKEQLQRCSRTHYAKKQSVLPLGSKVTEGQMALLWCKRYTLPPRPYKLPCHPLLPRSTGVDYCSTNKQRQGTKKAHTEAKNGAKALAYQPQMALGLWLLSNQPQFNPKNRPAKLFANYDADHVFYRQAKPIRQ